MNGVAIAFLLRHRFAGEHRFIKPGFALAYHAVDRDAVAGSQAQRHAGLNFRERQIFLALGRDDPRRRRRQVEQFFQRFRGALAGAGLQHMAEVNQADNHRAGFVIEMAGFHREPLRPQVDAHRVQPGDAGAERHQRIHGGGAVFQAFPRAAVEVAAGEDHDGEGDKADNQPQRTVVVADHHVIADHAPDHHRHADQQGDNRLPAKTFHRREGGFLLTFAALQIVFDRLRAIAGFLHRLH